MAENNRRMEEIVTQHNVKTDLLMTMYTAARERSIVLLSMVSIDDPFEREEKYEYFNELATKFVVARIELGEKNFDQREQALYDEQATLIGRAVPFQNKVVELLVQDDVDAAVEILLKQAIPAQDMVLAQLQAMLDYEQQSARRAFDEASQVVRNTTIFMMLLAISAIMLSAGIAYFVIRKTRRDEAALREARDHLEERVKARTRELSEAYDDLKYHEREIAIKNQALESLSNKLSKYLSPQVYASIFSGKQEVQLTSRRRKLTVFFSDIAGFTEVTDRMESEELTQLINRYLTEMSRVALEHGATIDKYVGDAIMVFFGDPDTRGVKQDALACVKMAIAMQQRMTELAAEWREAGIESPLTCRIGIHTGYCTVGNFGSEDRMDYTIIGGTVNLASRLEHEALSGGILISYDTYAHVKDEIYCEEMGQLRVRGIAHPVTTYRVIDLYQNLTEDDRTIQTELPHLQLNADPKLMSEQERQDAAAVLREVADHLVSDDAGTRPRAKVRKLRPN
jgi:class 3 adenylate cyclase